MAYYLIKKGLEATIDSDTLLVHSLADGLL
jgi:hypothetical protein